VRGARLPAPRRRPGGARTARRHGRRRHAEVGRQAAGAEDALLRARARDPRRPRHGSVASRRDAARDRRPHPRRHDDPRDLGRALPGRPRRVRPGGRRAADRRRARHVLHLRLQPAPPLPGRRRRGDLERAEHGPVLAAAIRRERRERRAGALRRAAHALLRRPARRARQRQRDRRLFPTRLLQPQVLRRRCPFAGRVLSEARARLPREPPDEPDLRHDRPQPVPEDERRAAVPATRAGRSARATTTS
jgi:hypothetical protein